MPPEQAALHPIAEDVWGQEHDLRLPGGVPFPCRATLVRLRDGGLLLHSPLPIDDATASAIDALGEVRALVAPSCVHWLFLKRAKERYPRARVFGAPGLERKVGEGVFEPLPESGCLEGVGEELRVARIGGVPYIGEHVFLHVPSRSLLVTDLLFNIRGNHRFMMNLFLRLTGTHDRTAQSRIWRVLMRDRAAAGRSVNDVLGWGFDRIVVGHGEVVTEDAQQCASDALAWMIRGRTPGQAAAREG